VFALCATFQNIDASFHDDQSLQDRSSSTSDLTGVFGVRVFAAGSRSPLSDVTPMTMSSSYLLRATGSTLSTGVLTWVLDSANTAACTLVTGGHSLERNLICTTPGVVKVNLKAIWPDSDVSVASFTKSIAQVPEAELPPKSDSAKLDPDHVIFRIKSGTGASAWNSSSNPVQVFVGQTLTIYNDDSTDHRLHTSGSPFAHQVDRIGAHSSSSFVIVSAHSGKATDVYDHDSATTAIFYINSIEPRSVARK
jgi:hypothetical protein